MSSTKQRHLIRYSLIFCTLFCLGIVDSEPAYTASNVRVVVMARKPIGVNKAVAARIQRYFRYVLHKQPGVTVLDPTRAQQILLSRTVPDSFPPKQKKLRQLLKKAKAVYRITLFPLPKRCRLVLRALNQAEEIAEEISTYMEDRSVYLDLYLYFALAYHGLNNKTKARQYTIKMLQLDPNFQPSGVPASFRQFQASVLRWINQSPRYTMKLDSKPTGARLYHNYKYIGKTPQTLSNLPRGQHLIRLVYPAYKNWEQIATLDPKKLKNRRTIKATIPLQPDPEALIVTDIPLFAKDAGINDDFIDRLEKIAVKLKVRHVYVTEPHKTAKGLYLKVAMFKRGVRIIKYKLLALGTTRASYQAALHKLAKWLRRQIAAGK